MRCRPLTSRLAYIATRTSRPTPTPHPPLQLGTTHVTRRPIVERGRIVSNSVRATRP